MHTALGFRTCLLSMSFSLRAAFSSAAGKRRIRVTEGHLFTTQHNMHRPPPRVHTPAAAAAHLQVAEVVDHRRGVLSNREKRLSELHGSRSYRGMSLHHTRTQGVRMKLSTTGTETET